MDIEAYKKTIAPLIAIQSISTDSSYKDQVLPAVDWLMSYFKDVGYQAQVFNQPNTNPLVFAEYRVDPLAQTILIYGHYDIVPASDQEGWLSDPFTLEERDGYLYGRGTADNKGQTFIHLYAIQELIKENALRFNVKVILEGNEETGNVDLATFIATHKDLLKADTILISDGPAVGDQPTIEAALRAAINITLRYTSAKAPLHDGLYGGAVPNAAHELTKFVAKLTNDRNEVMIPGFYDGVDEVNAQEIACAQQLVQNETDFAASIGVKQLLKPDIPFYVQTGLQPGIQVSSVVSGYVGAGYGGSVPHQAEVKLNLRIVQKQEPEHVYRLFETFVKEQTPPYIDYTLEHSNFEHPVKIDVTKPIFETIQGLVTRAYGKPALIRFVGGSIPVIADFQHILGIDPLVISLANEDSNEHGPNENMKLDLLKKAYQFSRLLFSSSEIIF